VDAEQERLVSAAPADAKSRELLAIGYIRLGDVTGNLNVQNLGDSQGSLSFFRKAFSNAEAAAAQCRETGKKVCLVAVLHGRIPQILMTLGDGPGEVAEIEVLGDRMSGFWLLNPKTLAGSGTWPSRIAISRSRCFAPAKKPTRVSIPNSGCGV
jgi:hypothetical protein